MKKKNHWNCSRTLWFWDSHTGTRSMPGKHGGSERSEFVSLGAEALQAPCLLVKPLALGFLQWQNLKLITHWQCRPQKAKGRRDNWHCWSHQSYKGPCVDHLPEEQAVAFEHYVVIALQGRWAKQSCEQMHIRTCTHLYQANQLKEALPMLNVWNRLAHLPLNQDIHLEHESLQGTLERHWLATGTGLSWHWHWGTDELWPCMPRCAGRPLQFSTAWDSRNRISEQHW